MATIEELRFGPFVGQLARPETSSAEPRPGVLVMADALGIGDFSVGQAAKLADLGFVALAGDIYGGGFRAVDAAGVAEKGAMLSDHGAIRANVRSNMDALAAVEGVDPSRLAAIGYCMGGTAVLELARSGYACCAVVSFHGVLGTSFPAGRGDVVASVLVCTGADDPYAPLEEVLAFQAEMTAAEADSQVLIYSGTQHSWTNPDSYTEWPGIAYHPKNAERSWVAMLDFVGEAFGAERTGVGA